MRAPSVVLLLLFVLARCSTKPTFAQGEEDDNQKTAAGEEDDDDDDEKDEEADSEIRRIQRSANDHFLEQLDKRAIVLHQRGMSAALTAAARVDLHWECNSPACAVARNASMEGILAAFDANGGVPVSAPARNASAIGILVASSPRMYGVYPVSPMDGNAPLWLRAILDMPDLRRHLCNNDFSLEKIWAPQAIYLAAYMRVVLNLDVRILTCTLRSCLRDVEAVGSVLLHKCQTDDLQSFGNRGELLRDVRWAMLNRLEARSVRVYPSVRQLWLTTTKGRVYEALQARSVPIAPFFHWTGPTPPAAAAVELISLGWEAALIKPSWSVGRCGGIALGIVKLNLTARTAESTEDVHELATQLQGGMATCRMGPDSYHLEDAALGE